jgi:hypothetical protein
MSRNHENAPNLKSPQPYHNTHSLLLVGEPYFQGINERFFGSESSKLLFTTSLDTIAGSVVTRFFVIIMRKPVTTVGLNEA